MSGNFCPQESQRGADLTLSCRPEAEPCFDACAEGPAWNLPLCL